jgi:deazaflavin-dependent oxidoreductase (nitroreductase family)
MLAQPLGDALGRAASQPEARPGVERGGACRPGRPGQAVEPVVASAAGSAHNPGWYLNLAAHPGQVWIELPRRKLRVAPEQLDGTRQQECWLRIISAQPRYAKYQAKTDRLLSVIRLVPADASGS